PQVGARFVHLLEADAAWRILRVAVAAVAVDAPQIQDGAPRPAEHLGAGAAVDLGWCRGIALELVLLQEDGRAARRAKFDAVGQGRAVAVVVLAEQERAVAGGAEAVRISLVLQEIVRGWLPAIVAHLFGRGVRHAVSFACSPWRMA